MVWVVLDFLIWSLLEKRQLFGGEARASERREGVQVSGAGGGSPGILLLNVGDTGPAARRVAWTPGRPQAFK
jgi:hypothetical protein